MTLKYSYCLPPPQPKLIFFCVCLCAETGLLVFTVSLAVGSVVLLVLVIGSLMYCIRKRRPVKRYMKKSFCFSFSLLFAPNSVDNLKSCVSYFFRCFRSTSGQSNPLFRSSSTRGSPRVGATQISQPIFVESSATQACKPLTSAVARPQAGALRPSRTAPEASSCTRASSYHMTLPFLA